jgi:hypothetical protein
VGIEGKVMDFEDRRKRVDGLEDRRDFEINVVVFDLRY